jgi:hypothetical protein
MPPREAAGGHNASRLVAEILWQVPSINAQVLERDALGRRRGWSEAARNPRD